MPYDNIAHVGAQITDQNLTDSVPAGQPRILAVGPATSGLTYELWRISNIRQAEVEFGAGSDVLRGIHEAAAQGAENLAIMRCGGRQGNIVITDDLAATLTITPEYRDDAILAEKFLSLRLLSVTPPPSSICL